MKPEYISNYTHVNEALFETLLKHLPWINRDAPRDECFMALEQVEYSYGSGDFLRTYQSVPMDSYVSSIMYRLNAEFGTEYNVCFLNYYSSEKEHLGWHADDSPEMDNFHPIAVVSLGAERYIYVKDKDFKGNIPTENKYLLENGSLFIMPARYQEEHLHKIPKHDQPCGGRISLTFRKML